MKKILRKFVRRNWWKAILIALIAIMVLSYLNNFGISDNDSLKGEEKEVIYSLCNIREDASTSSPVVAMLRKGDSVVLTGKICTYTDSTYSRWAEVQSTSAEPLGWVSWDALK